MSCSHSPEALSYCGVISVELNIQIVGHGPCNTAWVFIACVAPQQWGRLTWAIVHCHIVMMHSIFQIEGCELELKEMDNTITVTWLNTDQLSQTFIGKLQSGQQH